MRSPVPTAVTILSEAVEITSPDERRAYLDRACGGDPALCERVERLVANHFRAGSFLEHPPAVCRSETGSCGKSRCNLGCGFREYRS